MNPFSLKKKFKHFKKNKNKIMKPFKRNKLKNHFAFKISEI